MHEGLVVGLVEAKRAVDRLVGGELEQARVSAVIDIDDGLKDAIYPPNSASSSRRESGGVGPLPGFSGRPKSAASASGVSASAAASESAAPAEPRTQSEIEIQAVSSQCRHPSGAAVKVLSVF